MPSFSKVTIQQLSLQSKIRKDVQLKLLASRYTNHLIRNICTTTIITNQENEDQNDSSINTNTSSKRRSFRHQRQISFLNCCTNPLLTSNVVPTVMNTPFLELTFAHASKSSQRYFSSSSSNPQNDTSTNDPNEEEEEEEEETTTTTAATIRLSKLIAQKGINMQMSRKSAEAVIYAGLVTVAGRTVVDPSMKIPIDPEKDKDSLIRSIKVAGKHFVYHDEQHVGGGERGKGKNIHVEKKTKDGLTTSSTFVQNVTKAPRVWIAHKLKGELVAEHDPLGRPSLIERLYRGGVGKSKRNKNKGHQQRIHLKPIGRLDMMTEGLILVTNDGSYVREMTLPSNKIHRSYRVRVHGRITPQKLNSIRKGITIDGTYYKGMNANLELTKNLSRAKGGNTNSWLRITCTEGKNRMIRKVLDHLGLQVTRLIRTSFGDYDLNTIPPGLAIEVPYKPLQNQKRKGLLTQRTNHKKKSAESISREMKKKNESLHSGNVSPSPVEWICHT